MTHSNEDKEFVTMRVQDELRHAGFFPRRGCMCCAPEVQSLARRIAAGLSRRGFIAGVGAATVSLALPGLAAAQSAPVPAKPARPVLFTNMRLFDGASAAPRAGMQVLVTGNRIAAIDSGNAAAPEGAQIIDCGGRTLMPGLIDAHWHSLFAPLPIAVLMTADVGYLYLAAAAEAERTLLRGFTTIRDLGGPAFALKQVIDQGLISGPRIYPSGAMISQTGGHGDFRLRREIPRSDGELSHSERVGASAIADGPDEVLRRVREQLLLDASQIKLAGGGGIASLYDPLDSIQYGPDEIRAAVGAAADWNTYVTVHLYTPAAIRRYVQAGVRCIEHGHLADEDAARMIVDHGVWWSLQPFLAELRGDRYPDGGPQQRKQQMVWAGTDRAYQLAIRHKAKIAWGTDILFAPEGTAKQGKNLAAMTRWFTPAQALTMATCDNGVLMALSGPRNPYDGKLGVIEKDAFADILVVDGDPTNDLSVMADPESNLKVIMKDGRVHKNKLAA